MLFINTFFILKVGIVAWGVKCGTPNVPGVYASVTQGLCFIDWATKCLEGDKYIDFYDIKGCENWSKFNNQSLLLMFQKAAVHYTKNGRRD